jgi:hypothetical protein
MRKNSFVFSFLTVSLFFGMINFVTAVEPASVTLTGDWTINVIFQGQTAKLTIDVADMYDVKAEKYDRLPLYNEGRTWNSELILTQTKGEEGFPTAFALIPGSVVVRDGAGTDAKIFDVGKDYNVFTRWLYSPNSHSDLEKGNDS